jgi:hypothetical protein
VKYRKKSVVIEAEQYTDDMRASGNMPAGVYIVPMPGEGDVPVIHTLEGDMIVRHGDYVITGIKGEKYPCKPDIFAATYEPVTE